MRPGGGSPPPPVPARDRVEFYRETRWSSKYGTMVPSDWRWRVRSRGNWKIVGASTEGYGTLAGCEANYRRIAGGPGLIRVDRLRPRRVFDVAR